MNLSTSPLSVQDRTDAEKYIVKIIQQDHFGALYSHNMSLKGNICYRAAKKMKRVFQPLKTLSMFCDENGFLCSHSRIINADKPFDTCFPVILLKRHNFLELLDRKMHYDLGHFGWSYVLTKIRERN